MSANSIKLSHPTGVLHGKIQLPASKSESNRALLIQALSKEKITLHHLSEANDTVLLQGLLHAPEKEINAEDAGTVMRFLTAYFSLTNQPRILTGTERMCQRPIGILVEALRELGAGINYLDKEGFPPLEILEFKLKFSGKAKVKLRGDVSSQYISALLLCAPALPGGLELELEGKIASRPYIDMTLALMREFGVEAAFEGNKIALAAQQYKGGAFAVEADWSAASYWYSMVALAKEAEILLLGLKENSLQGDSQVAELMKMFGVKTTFLPEGALLTKTADLVEKVAIDFSDIPDLAQSFAVLAAAKNVELEMTGLESLRIKETDRIAALQHELAEIGTTLEETEPGTFLVKNDSAKVERGFESLLLHDIQIKTYHDHRMAMAFAPLALLDQVEIEAPEVVRKSYPDFWVELEEAGFLIQNISEQFRSI
jgi:3-phosphoshikimate 1-carboxyvinyltransferase